MPLYIKSDAVADLVTRLATLRGVSKQQAVKLAVQAELDKAEGSHAADDIPLREKFAALRAAYPLPPPTGELADKAFFDELSGGSVTIFVDASALIAIIAGEADADALSNTLATSDARYISAIAIWETVAGLKRSHAVPVLEGRRLVDLYLDRGTIVVVPVDKDIADRALDAYVRYGKGRHPAGLNMGDCFAYASAKMLGASLLYKGGDFTKTDFG